MSKEAKEYRKKASELGILVAELQGDIAVLKAEKAELESALVTARQAFELAAAELRTLHAFADGVATLGQRLAEAAALARGGAE